MNATLSVPPERMIDYINVKLALLGLAPVRQPDGAGLNDIVTSLIAQFRQKERLLANHFCPADQRLQTFLYDYLQELPVARLPMRVGMPLVCTRSLIVTGTPSMSESRLPPFFQRFSEARAARSEMSGSRC